METQSHCSFIHEVGEGQQSAAGALVSVEGDDRDSRGGSASGKLNDGMIEFLSRLPFPNGREGLYLKTNMISYPQAFWRS